MHIQERTDSTLTTCTKMTEEVDRRHGVNGNSGSKSVNEDVAGHSPAQSAPGGRLKFFKDGKFILELVRGCAREGERAGWVSVPRKTFWPPAAPPPQPARGERAASLSVSDDNSSIQSSPWQRDHCWKQTNPRKNISKDLEMYYCRPNAATSATVSPACRRKRRRPYDPEPPPECRPNGHANGDVYHYMKLKKPYQYHKWRVYRKRGSGRSRGSLSSVVERLRSRRCPAVAKLCRPEPSMVSPRKRILRELERVNLEEKRRGRASPVGVGVAGPSAPPPPKPSPYSISSLLAPSSPPTPPRPPPLWVPYAPYGAPWPPLPHHPMLSEHSMPMYDHHANDLPLNLSKH